MITIHILSNISRSKGNQTMTFGQLIEYNMRNIFQDNHTQNALGQQVPDPLIKNKNFPYLWINCLKSYTLCFCCMFKLRTSKI